MKEAVCHPPGGDTARRRRFLSALLATVIVLISTFTFLSLSHSFARTRSWIKIALACLAIPGLALGALVDMFKSSDIHGSGSNLPVFVSLPVNWLLYYTVFLGTFKLRSFLLRRK